MHDDDENIEWTNNNDEESNIDIRASQLGSHHVQKVFYYPNTVNWKHFTNIISEKVLNYVAFCLRTQLRLKLRKRGSGTSIRLNIRQWNKKRRSTTRNKKLKDFISFWDYLWPTFEY